MRRIFTLSLALLCLSVISNKLFSQTLTNLSQSGSGSACATTFQNVTVTENFQNATGTQGFSGANLSLQSQGSSKYLAFATAAAGTYDLTTPTYASASSNINLEFQVGGNVNNITNVSIYAQTSPTNNLPITGNISLVSGTACVRIDNLPFTNTPFRFVIQITTNKASSLTFDDWIITPVSSNAVTPLPVHFSNVAVRKATEGVLVTWNVGAEQNVNGYDVEKSADGSSFTKIGFVQASNLSAYSFVDAKAGVVNFYRIKSVDIDGKFGYSTVVSLNGGAASVVVKAFMSDKNTLTVQHDAAQAGSRISVVSMDGRVVKMQLPSAGAQQTTVDLSSAQTGLYIIRYDNGQGGTKSIKVAK